MFCDERAVIIYMYELLYIIEIQDLSITLSIEIIDLLRLLKQIEEGEGVRGVSCNCSGKIKILWRV